jgi:hypothetical protein
MISVTRLLGIGKFGIIKVEESMNTVVSGSGRVVAAGYPGNRCRHLLQWVRGIPYITTISEFMMA